MSKVFLKIDQIQLINGGYLSTKEGNPVSNEAFVIAQKHAEWVVTFAELAKGKDFTSKQADTLIALQIEVRNALAKKTTKFVAEPKEVTRELNSKLAKEALAFINYQEDISKVSKINQFLQQFEVINEFEEFGLFFEQEITKLNKIYTMDEVVKAVTSVIDLLN